jgi:hypothetical protein
MKRASLLVAILALAAVAGAVAAPPAATAPAFLAVSQPAPAPTAAAAIIASDPCFDFCSRAYCVQGTTCGQNPATKQCGCWPDKSVSSDF